MTTAHTHNFNGIPVLIPNETTDADGFYISYNDYDRHTYGNVTTALVIGQMQHFYILNGDHRKEYNKLIDKGFMACYEYFLSHADQINKYSETKLP